MYIPFIFSRHRFVSWRPTFFFAEKYGGTRLIPKCRYCAYYRTFPRTYGSARLTKGRWSTWYHVEPWTCNANSLIFNGLSVFSPAYVAREGVGSSPVKARLDIKVAIYKEPASECSRSCTHVYTCSTRILDNTHFHIHAHILTHIRARGGAARKRTRGGTGRTYLHIESVS